MYAGDVQSELERTVERKIHERTFGRVHNLRVESIDGQIVVHGSATSYYVKLLALEAGREVSALIGPMTVDVDIQVT